MPTYAFWRKPNGQPYRQSDDKHSPRKSFEALVTSARINENGKVEWRAFGSAYQRQVVTGSIVILDPSGDEINRADVTGIVQRALVSLVKKRNQKQRQQQPLTTNNLLQATNKEAAKYLGQPLQRFDLVTSLPLDNFPATQITVAPHLVLPLSSRNRHPLPDALQTQSQSQRQVPKSQLVRVLTEGRTIHDAAERGIDVVALLCGLWNLLATVGQVSFGPGSRRPLGAVRAGPNYTLHFPDGKLATDLYWHEPDYVAYHRPFSPRSGWGELESNRKSALRKIRRLPYAKHLKRLLVRYADALAKPDPDVAFLQLWSILETITDTVGSRYELTGQRATWIFSDRAYAKEAFTYLQCCRNQYVHAARTSEGLISPVQLAKSMVDPHLLLLIENDLNVDSLSDYASFLNLPASLPDLRKQQQRIRQAIKLKENSE